MVASKEAGLGFEEKDVQFPILLALASVFERARVVLGGSASDVVFGLDQVCDVVKGA